MIVSRGVLMRAIPKDARIHARAIAWLNDQPRSRWHTLSEAAPDFDLGIDDLMRLWNQWTADGWMECRQDSGRSMYRPTERLPIVTKREREERLSLSDFYSALLELPAR